MTLVHTFLTEMSHIRLLFQEKVQAGEECCMLSKQPGSPACQVDKSHLLNPQPGRLRTTLSTIPFPLALLPVQMAQSFIKLCEKRTAEPGFGERSCADTQQHCTGSERRDYSL